MTPYIQHKRPSKALRKGSNKGRRRREKRLSREGLIVYIKYKPELVNSGEGTSFTYSLSSKTLKVEK